MTSALVIQQLPPSPFAEMETAHEWRKVTGSHYTPEEVVRSLVSWAAWRDTDRMLDPSCGDGRFLRAHANSVGVEQDQNSCGLVLQHSPAKLAHQGDFFSWAISTKERFECAAGNPPFIRYQRFSGQVRETARQLCERHGASFSSLSSSWAPFLVATASLLKPGGRMAFVVPAEIGHAPYAAPLLEFMVKRFEHLQIIALREKLFTDLAEDCWLLYAEGYGGSTDEIKFTPLERFGFASRPPRTGHMVRVDDWRTWNCRLRPFLLSAEARRVYMTSAGALGARRLGDVEAVDVVVTMPRIGPVLAVSMKGTLGAFRNLTNRMEEAIGDCTNPHISYPALVYGFFQVLRATAVAPDVASNDVCVLPDGTPSEAVTRYHDGLSRLEGRRDLREDPTKFEAVSLVLVKPDQPGRGTVLTSYPPPDSPLAMVGFFTKLYREYDLRFVYAAPMLETVTSRLVWDESSPALSDPRAIDYTPRVGQE